MIIVKCEALAQHGVQPFAKGSTTIDVQDSEKGASPRILTGYSAIAAAITESRLGRSVETRVLGSCALRGMPDADLGNLGKVIFTQC